MQLVSAPENACFGCNSPKHAHCHLSVTSVSPQLPCAGPRVPTTGCRFSLPSREYPTLCLTSSSSWGCLSSCARHGERGAQGVTAPSAHSSPRLAVRFLASVSWGRQRLSRAPKPVAGASGDGAAAFDVMELNEQRGSSGAAPSARSAELSGERAAPGRWGDDW